MAAAMHGALAMRVSLVLLLVLALGCGGGGFSPTEPARRDALVLQSVTPAEGARMRSGGEIQVLARLRYTLKQPAGGKIAVIVYPDPSGLPLFTDPLLAQVPVEGQQGEVALPFKIVLDDPDGALRPGFIVADFALFPRGGRVATASSQVRFEIIP